MIARGSLAFAMSVLTPKNAQVVDHHKDGPMFTDEASVSRSQRRSRGTKSSDT